MADSTKLSYECDPQHGLNFNQDQKKRCGFITNLTCGDETIDPDIKVTHPPAVAPTLDKAEAGEQAQRPVVSVLSKVEWGGQATNSITLTGIVSAGSQQKLLGLLHDTQKSTAIRICFVIYEYDNLANCWCTAFCTYEGHKPDSAKLGPEKTSGDVGKPIYGTMKTKDGDLTMTVTQDPIETEGGAFYEFTLELLPTEPADAQKLFMATSKSYKLIKLWGGKVVKAAK